MCARQAGPPAACIRIQRTHQLNGYWFRHPGHRGRRRHPRVEHDLDLTLESRLHGRGLTCGGVKPPADPWPVALEGGEDPVADASARVLHVLVRRIVICADSSLAEEFDDLLSPDREHRPHEWAAARRHSTQTRQTTSTQEMEHGALDEVVGRVSERDHIGACLQARTLQEFVSEGARRSLHRSARHGRLAPLAKQSHAKPGAHRAHLFRDCVRTVAQSVVKVRRSQIAPHFFEGDEQGGGVWSSGNCDEHTRPWLDE
jgi:hypothetical protein